MAEAVGRKSWRLDIRSPSEAIRAIDANCDGRLVRYLYDNAVGEFAVNINGARFSELSELSMRYGNLRTLEFVPAVKGEAGSGPSTGMMVIGAILLILGIVLVATGVGAPAGAGIWGALGANVFAGITPAFLILTGAVMLAGGLFQMLASPGQKDEQEKADNEPSYFFNGAVNMYRKGNPVPVGFGKFMVGSHMISAGIRSEDIDVREPNP